MDNKNFIPLYSILSLAAILVGIRNQRTQFWKRAIKESFQQNLVDIGLDLTGMVPGWVRFKIVSNSPALHSRWPLLLKIEISSNGQNCSILSQNVPKFELCKHNDELFSIYYRIFMNFELLPFYFELGGHIGWKSGSTDTILEEGHQRIISAKFG
jgi:hypothetical protein